MEGYSHWRFIFSISLIIGILLSFDIIFATGCIYKTKVVYWNNVCTIGPQTWYDFDWTAPGSGGYVCAIGASTTDYGHSAYYQLPIDKKTGMCVQTTDSVVWAKIAINQWPSGGVEGQVCKVRVDTFGYPCHVEFEGKWDSDTQSCVQCNSYNQKIERYICSPNSQKVPYTGPNVPCEAACGASKECDELSPGSAVKGGGTCDSNCKYSPPFDTHLSNPIIKPSSPSPNTGFTIYCPTNGKYDCIGAYAIMNNPSTNCYWSGWDTSNGYKGIFNCKGMVAGSYYAECFANATTPTHCKATQTVTSYKIQASTTTTTSSTTTTIPLTPRKTSTTTTISGGGGGRGRAIPMGIMSDTEFYTVVVVIAVVVLVTIFGAFQFFAKKK